MREMTEVPSMASSPDPFSFSRNYPLISSVLAFVIAQCIKFFTAWYKERRWDLKQLVGSGGMPSSHSATVTALAIAIGLHDGFGSSLFATSMIFACVVMYDAFGVRLHAGKQAEVLDVDSAAPKSFQLASQLGIVYEIPFSRDLKPLSSLEPVSVDQTSDFHRLLKTSGERVLNQIVYGLPSEHPLADTRPLRELLGHTPTQVVAGALLGCVTAIIGQLINIAAR